MILKKMQNIDWDLIYSDPKYAEYAKQKYEAMWDDACDFYDKLAKAEKVIEAADLFLNAYLDHDEPNETDQEILTRQRLSKAIAEYREEK